jgi:hypothetical protein
MLLEDDLYDDGGAELAAHVEMSAEDIKTAINTNKEISQNLYEALQQQEIKLHTELDLVEEEELGKEIEELLTKIENQNIAESFKQQVREKITKVVQKVADVTTNKIKPIFDEQFDFQPPPKAPETSDEKRDTSTTNDAAATTKSSAEKIGDSVAMVMMQKKLATLKKELEVSDQKARSVTLQWLE